MNFFPTASVHSRKYGAGGGGLAYPVGTGSSRADCPCVGVPATRGWDEAREALMNFEEWLIRSADGLDRNYGSERDGRFR